MKKGQKMSLQVLVSTMYQTDYSLLEKMNIQSDAIVVNQCDKNEFEKVEYNGHSIKFLSLNERGVGLSRNTALMRASADICVFADEDVRYVDGYKQIIINAFKENPNADIIMFNVPSRNIDRPTYLIKKRIKVKWYNCLKYGAVKIAVKTEKLKHANIYFSLLFGGGAKYGSGEDSLFAVECIKKGLQIYTDPTVIGYVSQDDSTWFEGYTDKYFVDKGALFACISRKWAKLLCFQFVLRHRKMFNKDKSIVEAFRLMIKGVNIMNRKELRTENL